MGHTLQRLSAVLGKRAQSYSVEELRKCRGPSWKVKEPWTHCQLSSKKSTASSWTPGPGACEPQPVLQSIWLRLMHLQQNLNAKWETSALRSWENEMAKIFHGLEGSGDNNAWWRWVQNRPSQGRALRHVDYSIFS